MEVVKDEVENTVEEEVVGELPEEATTGQTTLARYIEMPATFNENGEMELEMNGNLTSGGSVTEIIFINVNEQNLEDDVIMMQEQESERPTRAKRRRRATANSKRKKSKKQNLDDENYSDGERCSTGVEVERTACSYAVQTIFLTCSEAGCDLRFGDKKSRNAHLMSDHGVSPYQCPLRSCLEKCSNSISLGGHIRTCHGDANNWICPRCESVFKKYKLLYMHMWIMHDEGYFKCPQEGCEFEATYRKQVYNHIDHRHQVAKNVCAYEDCTKAFTTTAELKAHERRVHLMLKPYRCKWPNCRYSSEVCPAVIRHIRTQHFHLPETIRKQREKNIVDTRDPREFLETIYYPETIYAVLEPSDEEAGSSRKKYRCQFEDCKKAFHRAANLKVHERMHLGLRPYLCVFDREKCDFSTERKDTALQHIRTVHLNLPRSSRELKKLKSTVKNGQEEEDGDVEQPTESRDPNDYLEIQHEEFDDPETKEMLAEMAASISFSNQTEAEMNAGTVHDEIQVVADGLQHAFELGQAAILLPPGFNEEDLLEQLNGGKRKKKKGNKPKPQHVCPIEDCGKIFRRPANLKDHLRVHSGAKPYKCSWNDGACTFTSSRKENVVQHVRTNHLGLPRSKREQAEKEIPDVHNPALFVEVLADLLNK